MTTSITTMDGTFDVTHFLPASASTVRRLGRGFLDYDNDGWPDIFMPTATSTADRRSQAAPDLRQPKMLYRNLGNGRFKDVSAKAGPASAEPSAAAAPSATSTTTATSTSLVNIERTAIAAAQRRRQPEELAPRSSASGTRSNRRDRHARAVTAARTSRSRSDERLGLLFAERSRGCISASDRRTRADTIEVSWPSGAKESLRDVGCEPDLRDRGSQGNRRWPAPC